MFVPPTGAACQLPKTVMWKGAIAQKFRLGGGYRRIATTPSLGRTSKACRGMRQKRFFPARAHSCSARLSCPRRGGWRRHWSSSCGMVGARCERDQCKWLARATLRRAMVPAEAQGDRTTKGGCARSRASGAVERVGPTLPRVLVEGVVHCRCDRGISRFDTGLDFHGHLLCFHSLAEGI